ncbi:cytochrome-c oxidase, cbb3-type subunit III [Devosia sp. 63-57]|uniref:cytochrome-c oxidase, cbb3-type subunit III n=1 Tax=Devosia sp. 63-57 TaxID=1895751 RepID=UPI00086E159D|nr:cytochrome-c oxidase, cbb3-type subunit III [Devosia sp. 63-57]ODT51018.1 MAG: cytochrome-c oxidase, cbb3-type subunit III [Pelagibacterium sp. SCN 63-126]ODU84570.1 MAG: cytochrome-c oxidase, cbb3-type subunit III [Pelagibacterium sp. SCN 63-17]OJX44323.1 MAG: cytochrome-c oxidase, cbb3-type subunit III [Devosia sp. 63-57]
MGKPEKDEITGQHTTGHEWDGIRELTTPVPNWWLLTWFASIAVALLYVVFFPSFAVPGWVVPGALGNSARNELAAETSRIAQSQAGTRAALLETPITDLAGNADLYAFAWSGGRAAFAVNCIACHGAGAGGQIGQFPSLIDDDWLWGGTPEAIEQTILHGIRSPTDEDTRLSEMPPFADALSAEEISDVADYVLSLSLANAGDAEVLARGQAIYSANCEGCHQPGGTGGRDFGAPRLDDAIWLYGGSKADIIRQINAPRMGVMPAFVNRLDPATIRMLAVYVHSLGGGETSEPSP